MTADPATTITRWHVGLGYSCDYLTPRQTEKKERRLKRGGEGLTRLLREEGIEYSIMMMYDFYLEEPALLYAVQYDNEWNMVREYKSGPHGEYRVVARLIAIGAINPHTERKR